MELDLNSFQNLQKKKKEKKEKKKGGKTNKKNESYSYINDFNLNPLLILLFCLQLKAKNNYSPKIYC